MRTRFDSDLALQAKSSIFFNRKLLNIAKLIKSDFNGLGGVNLSGEVLAVKSDDLSEDRLWVTVWLKSLVTEERPVYFDTDSDEFSESFGAANISHYAVSHSELIITKSFSLPNNLLYLSDQALNSKLTLMFNNWVSEKNKLELELSIERTESLLNKAKKELKSLESKND